MVWYPASVRNCTSHPAREDVCVCVCVCLCLFVCVRARAHESRLAQQDLWSLEDCTPHLCQSLCTDEGYSVPMTSAESNQSLDSATEQHFHSAHSAVISNMRCHDIVSNLKLHHHNRKP